MSEAALPAAPPRKPRNWMKYLLIASLALNALVIGVVLRGMWQIRAMGSISPSGLESRLPAFVDQLPPERRNALKADGLLERPAQLRPLRLELRRARAEAARAFTAEPFDRQAFVAAQTRVYEAEANLRRGVLQVLPDIAARMTGDERQRYLRWGREPHNWRGKGPARWGGPPDDDRPDTKTEGLPRRP